MHDCAEIQDKIVVMAVERDETGDGWEKGVAACIINRFQALNPSSESILAYPKVLQDVSCRNAELPVESPETSYRRLNLDPNVSKSCKK